MTENEFRTQIARLEREINSGIGGNQVLKFGNDRSRILWAKVRDLSAKWFENVIDCKIGSFRYMPLPADFDEDIAVEKERSWANQKDQNEKDAKKFLTDDWGTYPNEEKREICRQIREIIENKMPEKHKQSFIKSLSHAADSEVSVATVKDRDVW